MSPTLGTEKATEIYGDWVYYFTESSEGDGLTLEDMEGDSPLDDKVLQHRDRNQYTLLHHASKYRRYDWIKYLLQKGAGKHTSGQDLYKGDIVDIPDSNGHTLLTHAVDKGDTEVMEWLIRNGANVASYFGENIQLGTGDYQVLGSPLYIAVKKNRGNMFIQMLSGSMIKKRDERERYLMNLRGRLKSNCYDIFYSVVIGINYYQRLDMLQYLFDNEYITKDYREKTYGYNLLHMAVKYEGGVNIIEYLVEQGVPIAGEDRDGKTLLHYAYEHKRTDVLDFLRQKGESLKYKGRTVLDLKLESEYSVFNPSVDDWMISYTDLNHQDEAGNTQFQRVLMSKTNNREKLAICILKNTNLDLTVQNNKGDTALHTLCKNLSCCTDHEKDLLREMIALNPDLKTIKNSDGKTALAWAQGNSKWGCIEILQGNSNDQSSNEFTPPYQTPTPPLTTEVNSPNARSSNEFTPPYQTPIPPLTTEVNASNAGSSNEFTSSPPPRYQTTDRINRRTPLTEVNASNAGSSNEFTPPPPRYQTTDRINRRTPLTDDISIEESDSDFLSIICLGSILVLFMVILKKNKKSVTTSSKKMSNTLRHKIKTQ